ncbi:MAG TPA: hypothetical protein VES67_02765 [Vicinamibacterales bacterium]|nr:hypothetical protein [Vicinamibacterales bacterium]
MRTKVLAVLAAIAGLAVLPAPAGRDVTFAQGGQAPGRSIGTISTRGDLIVLELNEDALGRANMFDLEKRTVRFAAVAGGYRAETAALRWDPEFGAEMTGAQVSLKNFVFPFSGRNWDSFSVGTTGSIAFSAPPPATPPGGRGAGAAGAQQGGAVGAGGGRGGGVTIGRFDQLQEAARTLVNAQPAICVFMKPRMSGTRYVKELSDRAVITWNLTEPAAGIQDFTWVPTVNRFQAVLFKDGAIEMSYEQLAARDAIVGIYPLVNAGIENEKPIASLKDGADPALPAHLDVTNVRLAAVGGLYLKVTFETRGPALAEGDAAISGVTYHVTLNKDLLWTIRGAIAGGRGGRGGGGNTPRYVASGTGVSPAVTVKGNTVSIQGILPPGFKAGDKLMVSAEISREPSGGAADTIAAQSVSFSGLPSPEQDLSSLTAQTGSFATIFESFHYLKLPNPRDLTCTVIKALGDHFDFLAYYSDFRVDNQEAGTPSTGPLGGGPNGGAVTGIGVPQRALDSYCTAGRFQWQFVQPVYAGSNQMQERPPDGITDTSPRNIISYTYQIGERTPDRRLLPYNYGISQIAHEMGHRWSAFVSARIGTETIPLGPTHWARGLHAPVAFPFQRPSEASAMGGGVWQDNFDGTFTQLDDDYYVPATGWSYLDLYLMGLISASEVPDFFILRNLVAAGKDANGRPIFKADRTKVTITDVIAVEGPRLPDVDKAQKEFNTGIVVIVERGKQPSQEMIDRANGIRVAWIDYFRTTTGHRASMTTMIPK